MKKTPMAALALVGAFALSACVPDSAEVVCKVNERIAYDHPDDETALYLDNTNSVGSEFSSLGVLTAEQVQEFARDFCLTGTIPDLATLDQ